VPLSWIRQVGWDGAPRELSVRTECHGGEILESALEHPADQLARSRSVILLIHGFNVSLCSAGKSYKAFLKEVPFRWKARSFWVYWPGDDLSESPGLASKAKSAASYPFQLDRAEESGRVLARHISAAAIRRLRAGKPPMCLSIVAHSLGCRLALELVSHLGNLVADKLIRLQLLVLMAAAVPKYLLLPRQRYDLSRLGSQKTIVYFSSKDDVLKWVFRVGQATSMTNPLNAWVDRAALGREGLGGLLSDKVIDERKYHGHGGYWSDREIAWRITQELDGARNVRSRRLVAPRRLNVEREIAGRSVQPRTLNKPQGIHDRCCP
jgi:esterase/lipase superfamily enzyme